IINLRLNGFIGTYLHYPHFSFFMMVLAVLSNLYIRLKAVISMSTKKEAERASTEYDLKRGQNNAVDRALDETRDNIRRTVDEARREIPRNTQAINDYQEHNLQ